MRALTLLLACAVCLSGCRYQLGDAGTLPCRYQTISISYAKGDSSGYLTESLVRELAVSNTLRYCYAGGDLALRVCVIDCGRENIGFQRDENRKGRDIRRLLPDEVRLHYVVEFWVVENSSGRRVLGPCRICEAVDYDFDALSTDNELVITSLGQFTNVDEAESAAHRPLHDQIARKIIDYVVSAW